MLDHALAIQATLTSEERIGDILIRDDAEVGQVVIKFPSNYTPELRKRIRSAWFCTKGPRRAFRLRKISGFEVGVEALLFKREISAHPL